MVAQAAAAEAAEAVAVAAAAAKAEVDAVVSEALLRRRLQSRGAEAAEQGTAELAQNLCCCACISHNATSTRGGGTRGGCGRVVVTATKELWQQQRGWFAGSGSPRRVSQGVPTTPTVPAAIALSHTDS